MTPLRRFLGQLLIGTLRPFLYVWLKYLVNWKLVSPPPEDVKPPYLILSTHVSVFEMPLMLLHTKPNPVIVLHELHLVDKLFLMLLSVVGPIWRMQGMPDPRTVRQMKRAVESGRSVLIYPEGDLNWDGDSLKLDINMARAARFIGAPVLVFKTEGSYLGFPRWAHKARRGRVDLRYELAVRKEDFDELSDGQILEKLNKAFVHSERGWFHEGAGKGQAYRSSKPALGLERLLFLCPSCGAHSKTRTDDRSITCGACGFKAAVGADLTLGGDCGKGFEDVWQWHDWQVAEWERFVSGGFLDGTALLEVDGVVAEVVRIRPAPSSAVTKGGDYAHRILEEPVKVGAVRAALSSKGVELFDGAGKRALFVPMGEIRSAQVFIIGTYNPNWLILMTDEAYVNIQLRGGSNPCYPWLLAIRGMIAGRAASRP